MWPQIIALLAGMAIKAKGQRDYANNMRNAAAERARRQKVINDQNRAKVMQQVQQYAPKKRQQEQAIAQQGIQHQLNTDLMQAVQSNNAARVTTGMSNAQVLDQAARTRASANDASTLASLLSRYRAPLRTAQIRRRKNAAFTVDRQSLLARGRRQDIIDRNWLKSIRPDPTKAILGSALMTYGAYGLANPKISQGVNPSAGYGLRGSTVPGDAYQPARDIFNYGQ